MLSLETRRELRKTAGINTETKVVSFVVGVVFPGRTFATATDALFTVFQERNCLVGDSGRTVQSSLPSTRLSDSVLIPGAVLPG